MLQVNGKPLLEHILDRLRAAGFEQVLIVTGYRADTIESHFEEYPMPLTFVRQEVLNGTATAALLAREFAGEDPFLLTFGDILIEPEDYRNAVRFMEHPELEGVIAVKRVEDPFQGAAVYEENGRVTRIIEKPPRGTSSTNWNSAGMYAFRVSVFEELRRVPSSERGEYELTSAVSQMLMSGKTLVICEMHGEWRDVGRPEDLEAAADLI
jgi:UDP-N-acetylglucosamine diphosphorylase / glucose-1-phosphate thymidylyltransferase / UDP-N-acetylgalactosamine diphosphorylase / glucosamine-1-phosphate N-acetyltransferase / galactosamine-1-phosphate N-acetyltransferase